MRVSDTLFAASVAMLLSACSGGAQNSSALPMSATFQPPQPGISGRGPIRRTVGQILVSESFASTATSAKWFWKDNACLTAGTSPGAPGVIPGCSNPPQDPPGSGKLRLTAAATSQQGFVGFKQALPTANGLDMSFDLCSYGGSEIAADGTLVWFSSPGHPANLGQESGSLGYLKGVKHKQTGMHDAYLGIGFDEYGNFSQVLPGGPGYTVPETIAIGGAQSTGYHYLGGYTYGSGQPASLPYPLDDPSGDCYNWTLGIDIQLTAAGNLQVSIAYPNGSGFVPYYTANVVGLDGQPAVPSTLFVGFASTTGGYYSIHDIRDLTISTL